MNEYWPKGTPKPTSLERFQEPYPANILGYVVVTRVWNVQTGFANNSSKKDDQIYFSRLSWVNDAIECILTYCGLHAVNKSPFPS